MNLTYQNWLKGEFKYKDILKSDSHSISKDELLKINRKQEQILNNLILKETKLQKRIIEERLKRSQNRKQFIDTYRTCLETAFNKPINQQVTENEEFKSLFYGKEIELKIDYVHYDGVIKILKNDFDNFQRIHRKYVIQNIVDFSIIDSPRSIETKIIDDHIKVYVANNIYAFLNELDSSLSSKKAVRLEPMKISEIYKRDRIIEHLYEGLYPNYIETSKEEFITHFGNEFKPMVWRGTEPEIKAFIDMLVGKFLEERIIKDRIFLNNYENKLIEQHFVTSQGKPFKTKQLSNMKQESSYQSILDPYVADRSNLFLLVKQLEHFKKD